MLHAAATCLYALQTGRDGATLTLDDSQSGRAGGHPGAVQLLAADSATTLLATAAASGPPLLWTQPDLRPVGPVPGIDSCTALAWLR
jgi:hypothetical protein